MSVFIEDLGYFVPVIRLRSSKDIWLLYIIGPVYDTAGFCIFEIRSEDGFWPKPVTNLLQIKSICKKGTSLLRDIFHMLNLLFVKVYVNVMMII